MTFWRKKKVKELQAKFVEASRKADEMFDPIAQKHVDAPHTFFRVVAVIIGIFVLSVIIHW